ncbi:olfactory receptor 8I2-like [Denticeps clupeoides]|uniref:olfactory receptor 8I2-like n=1 Tax=Denticeps clupeoides TaxID=299321 RepID=UPI0010A3FF45|nr:olfactory receptor 8I2-like [Denticeps clupeoides]
MLNTTENFFFVLNGLNDTATNKQLYFSFSLMLYVFTIFVNLGLTAVILLDKVLHEPMYIFVCSLFINGIYGATSFYPKLLADLLSDVHVISHVGCFLQILTNYSYAFCEFTTLAMMAYDRYVAICKPLQYHSIMTLKKVKRLILFSWIFSHIETTIGVVLTARLPLCGRDIDKIYCANWAVVKLSCVDTTINNLYGYVLIVYHVSQSIMVIISYVHIIKACMRSQTERRKFIQTCLPHLVTLINFTISLVFDVLYARYGSKQIPQAFRNILAVEFLVVPPLLNPIIYGINLGPIRNRILRMFRFKTNALK